MWGAGVHGKERRARAACVTCDRSTTFLPYTLPLVGVLANLPSTTLLQANHYAWHSAQTTMMLSGKIRHDNCRV